MKNTVLLRDVKEYLKIIKMQIVPKLTAKISTILMKIAFLF